MIRSVTWQQLAVLVVCLAAAFAAHKFLGLDAGMAAGVVTSVIAFLMGRPNDPPSPPLVGAMLGVLLLAACGSSLAEVSKDVKTDGDKLKECRADARAAFFVDGKSEQESLAIYEACKKDGGL